MDYIIIVGLLAAAFTAIAFFPQLSRAWRTKSTGDISLGMLLMVCVSTFLWLVYGILINDLPLKITNFLVLVQAFIVLIFKMRYK